MRKGASKQKAVNRAKPTSERLHWQRWPVMMLAVILCVQCAMAIYFGREKVGYHEDEMYTYELANYPEGFLAWTPGIVNSWQSGTFYREAFAVTGERRFNYAIPYHNQEADVHPPLYYFVIHTVSSVVGTFSKWTGLIPNIAFALFSSLLLYCIGMKLLHSPALALAATALWGLGIGGMSSVMLIRMYAMMTTACLLLVWMHLRVWDGLIRQKFSLSSLLGLFSATVFGILTQYYFLIFCFFWCAVWFGILLFTRRWKALAAYTATEFGAIIVSIAFFPKMIYHLFAGSRGKEAFSNAASGADYGVHLRKVLAINSRELVNGWGKELLILLMLTALLCIVYRFCHRCTVRIGEGNEATVSLPIPSKLAVPDTVHITMQGTAWMATVVTVACYVLVVARVAPYQTDRYYMCIHPLIVLAVVGAAYGTVKFAVKKKKLVHAIVCVLTVLILAASYKNQSVNYLYKWREEWLTLLPAYTEKPVVVVTPEASDYRPDKVAVDFMRFDWIYRCKCGGFSGLEGLAGDEKLQNGFLLYNVGHVQQTEEEFFAGVRVYLPIEAYKLLASGDNIYIYYCELR